jgi:hypothetical protein
MGARDLSQPVGISTDKTTVRARQVVNPPVQVLVLLFVVSHRALAR